VRVRFAHITDSHIDDLVSPRPPLRLVDGDADEPEGLAA
jgi:hypothetical protein